MPRALTSCLAALLLAASAMPSTAQAAPQELDQDEAPTGGITREITDERPYSCPYCDLEGIDLSGRVLTDVNFAGANLRHADLRAVPAGALDARVGERDAFEEVRLVDDRAPVALDAVAVRLGAPDVEALTARVVHEEVV